MGEEVEWRLSRYFPQLQVFEYDTILPLARGTEI